MRAIFFFVWRSFQSCELSNPSYRTTVSLGRVRKLTQVADVGGHGQQLLKSLAVPC